MKRDGIQTSLWQPSVPDFTSRYTSLPSNRFDVVIVGGGITGVTTGLMLQKAGKNCLIAEKHSLCFGTTGGTTAHLNTFLDTDYHTVKEKFGEENAQRLHMAAEQALQLIKKNIDTYDIECGYSEQEGYLFSQDEKQTDQLNNIYQSSTNAGCNVEWANGIPVPVAFDKAIVYSGQGQFHPTQYVMALARLFEEAGGVVLQNCSVGTTKGEAPLQLETSLGLIEAEHVIYATHIPPGINLLHFRCAPYRSYAMAVTLQDDKYPVGLAYDMQNPYHYFRTQEVSGQKYLIVGGEDHKTAHVTHTEDCFRNLEVYIRKYYNVDKIAYQWSSQYFEPADGLAYIGHLPGNPKNVWVATGFSGNGMTYSHIAAITLSDLIVKGESVYSELFNPNRVKPAAGFANFVKENVDVVKEFIGKRLSQEKLQSLADLAPDEAKVVKYEGESIALYKNESGQIYAVNPVCTHAKCIVDWNSAEKSWDCPCHGARYDVSGQVLTGPAHKGLEVIVLSEAVKEKH
ncbi:FAD-dependent oxidoreductase [Flavisolibacter tropicus]|uniref:Oxidoreductase n=1 Tax=Flavisolibacter tropicus TaxID=1492898 RepID=A0A172TVP6_9BACT|nr:FAD-dependent oxidoreductase [Flavisolibacter tropicus]ANE51191.1 oxidoreductase [Flavisolibacter tropicus]